MVEWDESKNELSGNVLKIWNENGPQFTHIVCLRCTFTSSGWWLNMKEDVVPKAATLSTKSIKLTLFLGDKGTWLPRNYSHVYSLDFERWRTHTMPFNVEPHWNMHSTSVKSPKSHHWSSPKTLMENFHKSSANISLLKDFPFSFFSLHSLQKIPLKHNEIKKSSTGRYLKFKNCTLGRKHQGRTFKSTLIIFTYFLRDFILRILPALGNRKVGIEF